MNAAAAAMLLVLSGVTVVAVRRAMRPAPPPMRLLPDPSAIAVGIRRRVCRKGAASHVDDHITFEVVRRQAEPLAGHFVVEVRGWSGLLAFETADSLEQGIVDLLIRSRESACA